MPCFVLNNVLLLTLARAGVHYVPAVGIAISVLIPFSYALHTRYSYQVAPAAASFWRYALGQLANAPLAIILYAVLCDGLGLRMIVATPLVTATMVGWNFSVSLWAIARRARTR